METTEKRNLKVNFSKKRLHSSIDFLLRRSRIPTTMLGYDILRGVIFGMVRHPEITVKEAVEKSAKSSNFPGKSMDCLDGYDALAEVLETEIDISKYSEDELIEVIDGVVEGFVAEILKEYCYEITVRTLEDCLPGYRKYSIGGDFIKCMVFKKVYASESTYECMVDYAIKKVGNEIEEKLTITKSLEYLEPFLKPEATEEALKLKVDELVDKVYEFASFMPEH